MCRSHARNFERTDRGTAVHAYVRHTQHSRAADLFRRLAAHSPETARHSIRVSGICSLIAARIDLPIAETHLLITAARLHDVGKVLLPGDLLHKPGKLLPDEWEQMKEHPVLGERLAREAHLPQEVCTAIRHHHERWDGNGYPDGLSGERIPLLAQILTVADSFVAMTEDRPYRPGRSVAAAWHELLLHRGTQFSPVVVDRWLSQQTNEEAPLPRHANR